MHRRRDEHPYLAAIVERATGKAERLEPRRISRLDRTQVINALETAEILPQDHHAEITSHVLLSARDPWVDGKGHLNLLNPRTVYPENPSVHFVPESGQPLGRVEAWLQNLEPNAGYLARVEVASIGTSPFDVRAVTLGAGLTSQTFATGGGFDTLLLQFPSGNGGLGLVRIESADWSFYEIEVSRFEF